MIPSNRHMPINPKLLFYLKSAIRLHLPNGKYTLRSAFIDILATNGVPEPNKAGLLTAFDALEICDLEALTKRMGSA